VPSWLVNDQGYLAGLREYLVSRMELQGWQVVSEPHVEPPEAGAPLPVGMVLLRVSVEVEEFDVDMGDAPAGGDWLATETGDNAAHVVPLDDTMLHTFGPDCVCGPREDHVPTPTGTGHLFVHHSLDGREQHEATPED
jgi:hypothetical protein